MKTKHFTQREKTKGAKVRMPFNSFRLSLSVCAALREIRA
jgi:hypothetical protein